jgi:hypothetical protein
VRSTRWQSVPRELDTCVMIRWTSSDIERQLNNTLLCRIQILGSNSKWRNRGATALTNLGRLSSRRWQSFPTAPDGTGLTCGQHIEDYSSNITSEKSHQ